jgi:hypothetical protein
MRPFIFLCVLGACGVDHSSNGPPELTLDWSGVGMVVSEPAGIQCGRCDLVPSTSCPEPPLDGTKCSATFDAGTTIQLSITQQLVYFAAGCSSAMDPGITSCTFELSKPLTVTITGAEAVSP